MRPTEILLKQWIDEYFDREPNGLDVTAYVFDKVREADFLSYCGAKQLLGDTKKRRFDDEKRRFGKEIKARLESIFHIVDTLEEVAVDEAKWPELSSWVGRYHQHRVDVQRRKLW